MPSALSSTVAFCLRLRSTRTPTLSRLSISNSSQAPRLGMTLAVKTSLSDVLSAVRSKYTPGRTDELRDDDALGAVDDERAALGHEREVAHEDRLALDLTGGVVHELRRDEERRGEGEVLLLALLGRVLRRLEAVLAERQRHGSAEVLDRRDLLEDLLETSGLGNVLRPASRAGATRACHFSLPSSQSKLSVCRPSRSGTSRGSWILAKEIRREAVRAVDAVGTRCARQPRGVLPRASESSARCTGPWRRRDPRPDEPHDAVY